MKDYVEEVNTALATQGEEFYFDSLEDVTSALELKKEEYGDNAKRYAALALGISGSGVFGKLSPDVYSQLADQMEALSQSDLATAGFIGTLTLSTLPAYLGKRNKDKRDEIDQMIAEIEDGSFDDESTEFAYNIAEKLA